MTLEFTLFTILPAAPEAVYAAWLDSEQHAAMTGSPANIDPKVGGKFETWDGYISGTTLELEPGRRIVQAWRTTEFSAQEPDSHVEITLVGMENGTRLAIQHTRLPADGMQYKQGWEDFYITPMKGYFAPLQ
jgi:uncharacterized protein YndB with AHSA1/START domain